MTSAKKSIFKRIGIIIIAAFLLFSAMSMVITKLVYDAIFVRYDGEVDIVSPALLTMVETRQEVSYLSGDNRLAGYLYTASSDAPQDTLVVIAPGFHAGGDDYLWQIHSLLAYGWAVFAFDPTGSYGSQGDSAVGFAQELCDLDATLAYIEQNDRFGYADIALLGHSRGGYAACCAVGYDYDIAAVVSVSGINSAMEGVMSASVEQVGPVAYGNYPFLWLYQAMLFGSETLNKQACEEISAADVPVLIVHGSDDQEVPAERYSILSHREKITNDKVEYLICSTPEQNGHTSVLFDSDGTANDDLMAAINAFLLESIG